MPPETMPHQTLSEKSFLEDAAKALKDPQLRRNFKRAMSGLVAKRLNVFPNASEFEGLREQASAVRRKTLSRLPELLELLEFNCERNGIRVHWAETTEEANRIVLDIANEAEVRLAVKGKSMVSEEMGLNAFLEEHGIEAIESDLGEYIIQVDKELPSHIIMPAIHKNLEEISKLFQEKVDSNSTSETAEEMTATARKILRKKFHDADMGLSGVNFAVAETGTLCLVENEGNGRFCTTLPKIHVALMGIEKVVESLQDLPPLLTTLTGSATGQPITTYFNMISGPRREGEKDGPHEVHLVLLDNGRSKMYEDELLRETLLCIRCGACMNHCPVYTRIGGHAYNTVYPGPIGKILTPQIKGIENAGYLANASSLCGACDEVCPVQIPITEILLRLRHNWTHQNKKRHWTDRLELLIWNGWKQVFSKPGLYRIQAGLLGCLGNLLPKQTPILSRWAHFRSLPRFSKKSLHRLVEEEGIDHE